jgi:signal transduction histidine kinase
MLEDPGVGEGAVPLTEQHLADLGALFFPRPFGVPWALRFILAGQWMALLGLTGRLIAEEAHGNGFFVGSSAITVVVVPGLVAFAVYLILLSAWTRLGGHVVRLHRTALLQLGFQVVFFSICSVCSRAGSGLGILLLMPALQAGAAHEAFRRRTQVWALGGVVVASLTAAGWPLVREWRLLSGEGRLDAFWYGGVGVISVLLTSWWALRRPPWRRQLLKTLLAFLDLPECGLDIITEDHRVLWVNRVQKRRFPKVVPGDDCFAAFKGRTAVCVPCPVDEALGSASDTDSATEPERVGDRIYQVTARLLEGRTRSDMRAALEIVDDVTDVHATQVMAWEDEWKARRAVMRLFRAMLSHEAFGQLDALRGQLSRLALAYPSPEVPSLLEELREAISKVMEQIQRIRDPGDMHMVPSEVDPGEVIADVCVRASDQCAERNILMANRVEKGRYKVWVDRRCIEYAFRELVENAASFAPPHSEVTIVARLAKQGAAVQFELRQAPPSLSDEVMRRMFEEGWSTVSGNPGQGITTVGEVIQRQGGEFGVDNDAPSGPVFVVVLPIAPGKEVPSNGAA